MLTYYSKPVCLSLRSVDLPLGTVIEAAATLYQRSQDQFHLVLMEPAVPELDSMALEAGVVVRTQPAPRLLWLEVAPQRVVLTRQGNSKLSYRHTWEKGGIGSSRYWLRGQTLQNCEYLALRNHTWELQVQGRSLPQALRVEYELWSAEVSLGCYILSVEIHA
jgi:hypothetical protein